jgi:hypothetical protein
MDYHDLVGFDARHHFFSAIERKAPEVLQSLAQQPFEAFKKLGNLGKLPEIHVFILGGEYVMPGIACQFQGQVRSDIFGRLANFTKEEELEERMKAAFAYFDFVEIIAEWASGLYLLTIDPKREWILETACLTLWRWRDDPKAANKIGKMWSGLSQILILDPQVAERYSLPVIPTNQPFFLELPSFDAVDDTKASYRKNAQDRFSAALNSYLAAVTEVENTRSSNSEHFDWLALYQFQRMSYADIARSVNKSADGVRSGVREAANLIGLELRPANRGRRKGSKDKNDSRRVVRKGK